MGIRYYCDHCGLPTSNLRKFTYGEHHSSLITPNIYQQTLGGPYYTGIAGVAGVTGIGSQPMPTVNTTGFIPMKYIDLCPTCTPIWIKRVENLCSQSDPENDPKAA